MANIPGSNINEGINGGKHYFNLFFFIYLIVDFVGQHQQPYGSPAPQPRTGEHRYIIVLFEHQGRRLSVPKYNSRAKFSLKQFIEKHKLG